MPNFSAIYCCVFTVAIFASTTHAQPTTVAPNELPRVGFSIIKTGKVAVTERLLLPDGSFDKKIDTNFSAFLIKHTQDYLLFDTGLGSKIDAQYEQDMPYWQRPFFKFDRPVTPARQQLDAAGFAPVQKIIISHSHWDHAGGVGDFPEAQVFASQDEMPVIAQPTAGAGGTWPSQVADSAIDWIPLVLQPVAYKGYAQSLDLFNDGSVVLVAMPGHTAGSIGMFVTVDSGTCYFFIGDVAWKAGAARLGAPKFWAASIIVDHDREQTLHSVEQVRDVALKYPDLVLVPAHDGAAQDALGYFPHWVR
jgi:glyoxylase-like metal-dependent hydrolase (beta-lactamase superfamily II)